MDEPAQNVSPETLEKGAELLRQGELVAFPTETVYGLGADADNPVATAKIFAAKGRPADHPLIVHLLQADQIGLWAVDIPEAAWRLAKTFWPGPMTLILPRSARAHNGVTGGLKTVGLRVPSHPVARALLQKFGGAIAAPSANRFGHVSPTRIEHVRAEFGDSLPLILEGGQCEVGLESTIIDCSGPHISILRPGGITQSQIEKAIQGTVTSPTADSPACSGRLLSHYAPDAKVNLCESSQALEDAIKTWVVENPHQKLAVLSSVRPEAVGEWLWIPLPASSEECAKQLYASLREIDKAGASQAFVFYPTTDEGLGPAIQDRLEKAAGPRDRMGSSHG